MPFVIDARVKLHAGAQRRCWTAKSNQDIFAAVFKNGSSSECDGAALINAYPAECRTHIAKFGFAQNKSRVWTRSERTGGKPNCRNSASGGITVRTYQSRKKKPACRTKPLVVSKCGGRTGRKIGNRTGFASA